MLDPILSTLLVLLGAGPGQDPVTPPPAPSPGEVRSAVEALERAFEGGEAGERVRAIEAAASLADPAVVEKLAQGLDDEQASVRQAALRALRFQPHASAVDALHTSLRKKSRQKVEDKELAELLLAVGQHASPSSIELLCGGTLDRTREHSTRARIHALGRVRDPRAVAELIALMNKAGGGRGGAGNLFERDFRLSLWALTGSDQGAARESWMRWWNDNKRTLELSGEPPDQPRALAAQWRRMWSPPRASDGGRGGAGDGPGKARRGGGEGS